MRILNLTAVAALLGAIALAAGPPPVQIWSAADIKHTAAEIAPASAAKGLEGRTLGSYGTHSTALWRRTTSGQAELHKTKVDILIVEEGEATLLFGGSIPAAKNTSPVEIRGATIERGESR